MIIFITSLGTGTTFCLDKYDCARLLFIYEVYIKMRVFIIKLREMNTSDKENLRRIIRKMHKQNDYEKFAELTAAFNSTDTSISASINFERIEFSPGDPDDSFLLLLKNIHSVMREENCVYILCRNDNLHIIGLKEQKHILLQLDNELTLWELFCWTCRSFKVYFRKKKTNL